MSERGAALAGRLFEALLGTADLLNVYLGDRLGLYAALAQGGPATSAELAARAGIAERYAREWLEQQAVGGIDRVRRPVRRGERAQLLPALRVRRGAARPGLAVLPRPDGAHVRRRVPAAPRPDGGLPDGRGRRLGSLRPGHERGAGGGQPPLLRGIDGRLDRGRAARRPRAVERGGRQGGRHRMRGRVVLDLDRARVPTRAGARLRSGRARRRARTSERRGRGGRRPGDLPRGRPARGGTDRFATISSPRSSASTTCRTPCRSSRRCARSWTMAER